MTKRWAAFLHAAKDVGIVIDEDEEGEKAKWKLYYAIFTAGMLYGRGIGYDMGRCDAKECNEEYKAP
jgi:hypothetical protein